MKSQTTLVATNIRLQQWAMQIRACQNRPAGMDVSTWCQQNNITKANYYYRLRRVRQACLDLTGVNDPAEFIEVPSESIYNSSEVQKPSNEVVATITLLNGIRIELSNDANTSFIHSLMGAVNHVE